MKKFISCVVLLVGMCVNSWANTCLITLYQGHNHEQNIDDRSVSNWIIAYHDNQVVYLYSEKFLM